MEFHLALIVSMVVLDGYGIHSRSRMNAHWFNREQYPASIVFMEYDLALLVSMAVLNVTFTVAAECAGSTEIPGVQ